MGQSEFPVWFDGAYVPSSAAVVSVHSAAITQGAAVFEGIRGYWNPEHQQVYIFRLTDHIHRLEQSMRLLRISLPYSISAIEHACLDIIRQGHIQSDCYLRPTVFIDHEEQLLGTLPPFPGRSWVTVEARQRRTPSQGLHAGVSSWQRITDHAMPPRIKANANYFNSRLAQVQAHIDGYDQAIILNEAGKVSELPAACIMLVRDGALITPPVTDNILESITRSTILQFCREELHIPIFERSIDRSELYLADEIFGCGTGLEIRSILSVDRLPVGNSQPGPITTTIQERYFAIVHGQDPRYTSWCHPVYSSQAVPTS